MVVSPWYYLDMSAVDVEKTSQAAGGDGDASLPVDTRTGCQRAGDSVLTWDETFMAIARVVAKRSKDPARQVGAVIVSSDHRVLSLGYNGTPHGFRDEAFPWGKGDPDPLKNKYLYVVHSERNAILNYRGNTRDLEGSTVYVTLFPCNECMKEIAQAGVSRVVYADAPYDDDPIWDASKTIAGYAHVRLDQYEPTGREIEIGV